jgi:hypothetical protein
VLRAEAAVGAPTGGHPAAVLRDLSETQIAALRCRPGTVKSLLSRGLDAMKTQRAPNANAKAVPSSSRSPSIDRNSSKEPGGFGLVRFPP